MPAPLYTRETTDAEQRAHARERAARAARNGLPPSDVFSPDGLRCAFEGHEAELEELKQQAAQAPATEAEQREQRGRSRALQAMTDRVRAEQEAERRRQAEARKRLGWKKGEQP